MRKGEGKKRGRRSNDRGKEEKERGGRGGRRTGVAKEGKGVQRWKWGEGNYIEGRQRRGTQGTSSVQVDKFSLRECLRERCLSRRSRSDWGEGGNGGGEGKRGIHDFCWGGESGGEGHFIYFSFYFGVWCSFELKFFLFWFKS